MSAPQTPGQPGRPAPASAPLVVRTDRRAIDRVYRPLVIVSSVLLAVGLAAIVGVIALYDGLEVTGSLSTLSVLPFILIVISSVLNIAASCYGWGVRRTIDEVLVADASGLRLQTGSGRVHVPWQAVQSAAMLGSGRRRRLVLRVDTGASMLAELTQRQRERVARKGFPIGGIGIVPGLDAIAAAVAHGTQGRVQPR